MLSGGLACGHCRGFVLPIGSITECVAEMAAASARDAATVMALYGRWIGILIEQYTGRMPAWLAPLQVVVLSITPVQ